MKKEELFKKYSINESHAEWNPMIDNWMSVEVYRVMHEGKLPDGTDETPNHIMEFLDKFNAGGDFVNQMMKRDDWGSLYLTAKRMIYRYSDMIINPDKYLKK